MDDLVTFEISKKLEEKGFNYKCLYVYNKEQIINPEIVKEFGNLSDDGYYDLTKEGGGELDWDLVYIYEFQLMQYRDVTVLKEIVRAPTISQVLKWFREEKNIHIEVYTNASGYNYIISDTPKLGGTDRYWNTYEGPNDSGCWDSYEEVILSAIEYAIDNLI